MAKQAILNRWVIGSIPIRVRRKTAHYRAVFLSVALRSNWDQSGLDYLATVLQEWRQDQGRAQLIGYLVDGKLWTIYSDLEQDTLDTRK